MGLVKRSRIKRRRSILETEEEGLRKWGELQDWQQKILEMSIEEDSSWILTNESEIPLTQSQMKMLEKILRGDWIEDDKVRGILEAVFELGFYYERDRRILNDVRRRYLSERKDIVG